MQIRFNCFALKKLKGVKMISLKNTMQVLKLEIPNRKSTQN